MSPTGDTVYVYGVSSSADYDPASLHGVEGANVQAVEHDGLVALTSRLKGGALAARDVRAHWRVLERAFEHAAVLPVRFGTVLESDEAVRERLLDANREWLSARLAEMANLVQLNVKGRYDEEALLVEIVRSTPAIARLRERLARSTPVEQIELGRMVEREIARRRADDTELAFGTLEPHAVATHAEEVTHPAAFSLAFLVERGAQDRFSEAVGAVRQALADRVELRYVGPQPPFSFAQADLTGGSGPWA
jgi:hypothetical protein